MISTDFMEESFGMIAWFQIGGKDKPEFKKITEIFAFVPVFL